MKEIFVNSCFQRQIAQFSHLQKNSNEYKKAVPENTIAASRCGVKDEFQKQLIHSTHSIFTFYSQLELAQELECISLFECEMIFTENLYISLFSGCIVFLNQIKTQCWSRISSLPGHRSYFILEQLEVATLFWNCFTLMLLSLFNHRLPRAVSFPILVQTSVMG